MKRLVAVALALLSLVVIAGCRNNSDDIFVADAELQQRANEILDGISADKRVESYLTLREKLLTYKGSTGYNKNQVQLALDAAMEKYAGLDQTLNVSTDGAAAINETLFEYLVVRAYYAQTELTDVVLDESDALLSIILSQGFTVAMEYSNTTYQICTRYFYQTEDAYYQSDYYSVNTLESGAVEYLSIPLAYRLYSSEELEAYTALGESARAAEFAANLTQYVEQADIVNNEALKLIYSDEELSAFNTFLQGLTIDYINANNITNETEAYSNKQLLIELGDTRFVLRMNIYGLYMDVIQNKYYYTNSFAQNLNVLRQTYLGAQPINENPSKYIIVTP